MKHEFRPGTMAAKFIELAKPDNDGFSRRVELNELKALGLGFGNGGGWCRSDGPLGKVYNIKRHKEKRRIVAVQLYGFQQLPKQRSVRADIKKKITEGRCVVLDVGETECDHKDGRIYDKPVIAPEKQTLKDFQPMSKRANAAKRSHCTRCKETGKRYDATRLGYTVSQFKGNGDYHGSCVGCYWHDPAEFNRVVSSCGEKC